MNWFILRMHRLHVEKFGPTMLDLSNWIRAFKNYSVSNKEVKAQIRRMKEEGRAFNENIAKFRLEYIELKEKAEELERKVNEGFRR